MLRYVTLPNLGHVTGKVSVTLQKYKNSKNHNKPEYDIKQFEIAENLNKKIFEDIFWSFF
jgi:hypothetical protein